MKKPKCISEDGQFMRHRWLPGKVCERCDKRRNPAAGDKMFRPVKLKVTE